jgi:hypothetical protein
MVFKGILRYCQACAELAEVMTILGDSRRRKQVSVKGVRNDSGNLRIFSHFIFDCCHYWAGGRGGIGSPNDSLMQRNLLQAF